MKGLTRKEKPLVLKHIPNASKLTHKQVGFVARELLRRRGQPTEGRALKRKEAAVRGFAESKFGSVPISEPRTTSTRIAVHRRTSRLPQGAEELSIFDLS